MRIFCLYTGGTIGCIPGPEGLNPAAAGMAERLQVLASDVTCELTFTALPQLLDSSCMGPADWAAIADELAVALPECDAAVVLHGTDTMAYTAAALSFLLEGLGKPVVLTGSQRPWFREDSDAGANVRLALQAAQQKRCGVWLAFGGDVLPGRFVHKLDADADRAFVAPNAARYQPVEQSVWSGPRRISTRHEVLAVRLYPGHSVDWLAAALASTPPAALLLECYGSGNLPDSPALQAALRGLVQQNIPIVACTQCLGGEVHVGQYQAGSLLAGLGVISGGWLGVEACLAQLYVLLTECADVSGLRQRWQTC
ncbi:asparaginase [Chitinilyticum aquatile]|uniref:asparaginase n=1 Tax=Chitinilyticum aquatile TaxID=362520 RepID=UPI00138AAECC|nr:asparaginase [Chitinilyticum aquatile]